jgi:hypothetical protein
MSRNSIRALVTLAIFAVLWVIYVMNFGLYPRYFDIAWDEEVQQQNGDVIVIHAKRTFERRGARLSRYDERDSTVRRNTLTFTPTRSSEAIEFTTRMPIAYLGSIRGSWYAVIAGQGPYGNFPDEMPDRWGRDFTTLEQRVAILRDGKFVPITWGEAPTELVRMNLLPSIPLSELVALDGHKVTLAQKRQYEITYPTPYKREISRPLRSTKPEGVQK